MQTSMLARTALIVFVLWAVGCTSVVPAAHPDRPVAVYVTDYGIHSSLLLPTGDGRFVEYAFGDWNYSTLNRCWPNDGFVALFLSPRAGLGRRFIDAPPFGDRPVPPHPAPSRMQLVYVSQESVDRVEEALDARWQAGASHVVHNDDNGMDYVPDTEHYSLANNCNHLTARCLREMGCDIHGLVVISKFQVVPPPRGATDEASTASSHKKGILASARAN
jgi:hypothetical protein